MSRDKGLMSQFDDCTCAMLMQHGGTSAPWMQGLALGIYRWFAGPSSIVVPFRMYEPIFACVLLLYIESFGNATGKKSAKGLQLGSAFNPSKPHVVCPVPIIGHLYGALSCFSALSVDLKPIEITSYYIQILNRVWARNSHKFSGSRAGR